MLMPKKVKYRKQQRGRMKGKAWRGSELSFGDYGLKVMECGYITDRQIEASRVAMTRFIKRGGKIWLRLFPDKPVTKKLFFSCCAKKVKYRKQQRGRMKGKAWRGSELSFGTTGSR